MLSSLSASGSEADQSLVLISRSLEQTESIGSALGDILKPGDLLAVRGPLGAGKSALCRAVVRQMMREPGTEVPSPSYTLVNVYDAPNCEIWHADLYRLGDESELHEIGLEDAVAQSVVLVEWPERWPNPPSRRLEISITPSPGEDRTLRVDAIGAWCEVIERLERLQ